MRSRMTSRRRGALVASVLLAVTALAGCTASDGIAEQGDGGYISGDGSIVTIPAADREPAPEWSGPTQDGGSVGSADLDGVTVLNFWYASCPPCRAEAGDLEELAQRFDGEVPFLGVNVRDRAETAQAFMDEFGVTYPTVIDVETRDVVSAFAGQVPPTAVPTTLVLDAEGRVAVRIAGRIPGVTTVADLIDAVLAEAP